MSAKNSVHLVGNLTRPLTIKKIPSTQTGGKDFYVADTGIAVNKRIKKLDGTQVDDVVFIDLIFKGETMVTKRAMPLLNVGSHVSIEGELDFDAWTDEGGQKKSKHTIAVTDFLVLDKKPKEENDVAGNEEAESEQPPVSSGEDEQPFGS